MKKTIAILLAIVVMIGIMYAEYRFIMLNLNPYNGNDGTIYIEIFEQVDAYDAE